MVPKSDCITVHKQNYKADPLKLRDEIILNFLCLDYYHCIFEGLFGEILVIYKEKCMCKLTSFNLFLKKFISSSQFVLKMNVPHMTAT